MTPGFQMKDSVTGEPLVMKLKKSVYGRKQSQRIWNNTFHDDIVK